MPVVHTRTSPPGSNSGWRIATDFAENYELGLHTGEDWNGNGGGNTDLGQNVPGRDDGGDPVTTPNRRRFR